MGNAYLALGKMAVGRNGGELGIVIGVQRQNRSNTLFSVLDLNEKNVNVLGTGLVASVKDVELNKSCLAMIAAYQRLFFDAGDQVLSMAAFRERATSNMLRVALEMALPIGLWELLEETTEDFEGFEWFHSSFRKTDVTDSGKLDMVIWHGFHAVPQFGADFQKTIESGFDWKRITADIEFPARGF